MVFETNIEGCLVARMALSAVNSEGCDTSSTGSTATSKTGRSEERRVGKECVP